MFRNIASFEIMPVDSSKSSILQIHVRENRRLRQETGRREIKYKKHNTTQTTKTNEKHEPHKKTRKWNHVIANGNLLIRHRLVMDSQDALHVLILHTSGVKKIQSNVQNLVSLSLWNFIVFPILNYVQEILKTNPDFCGLDMEFAAFFTIYLWNSTLHLCHNYGSVVVVIITKVVSSNPASGEVYSTQLYVI